MSTGLQVTVSLKELGGDPVELQIVVEALHDERPFSYIVAFGESGAVGGVDDRADLKVGVRCGAAVEFELVDEGPAALFQGTEVKKTEMDRFLELDGAFGGQEHDRTMGVDAGDRGRQRGCELIDKLVEAGCHQQV